MNATLNSPAANATRQICYDGFRLSTKTPKAAVTQFLRNVEPWLPFLQGPERAAVLYYYAYALMLAGSPKETVQRLATEAIGLSNRHKLWFINTMANGLWVWVSDLSKQERLEMAQAAFERAQNRIVGWTVTNRHDINHGLATLKAIMRPLW